MISRDTACGNSAALIHAELRVFYQVFFFPQYLKLEVFRTFKKLFLAKIIEHLSECVSKPIP